MHVESIDVYVTYRCNLRCEHCFVGEALNTSMNMPFDSFTNLVDEATSWGTTEITLLGGEPSMYPRVDEAIEYVRAAGMVPRVVTNGGRSFQRLVERTPGTTLPVVYFSIDGSCPEVHDSVRGPGSFEQLQTSIGMAAQRGWRSFGIVSLSKTNMHDAVAILRLCRDVDLEHVNIHYVTARGFATEELVMSLEEWREVRSKVERTALDLNLHVRMDNGLSPHGEYNGYCAVRDESNLMVLPDGRTFTCALFFDIEGAHSYIWDGTRLRRSLTLRTEGDIVRRHEGAVACPAALEFNPDAVVAAAQMSSTVGCLYEKVDVSEQVVALRR